MNADDLQRLETVGTETAVVSGHVLIEPGQHGSGLYVLLEGTVLVEAPEGAREFGPGAVIVSVPCAPPTAREPHASGRPPTSARPP